MAASRRTLRPPTLHLRLLRALARALVIGALAGAAVGLFVAGSFTVPATRAHFGYFAAMGMLYALVLGATERGVGSWLQRAAPLRSRSAVAVHVAVQAFAALGAFTLLTVALQRFVHLVFPFAVLAFIGLLAVGIATVSHSVSSLTALHRRIQESERSAADAELRALRAQINPHFLFNSLNSIASLIRSRPPEAETVTENLAELFRYSLRASGLAAVTLADEVESVQIYLGIEKARFRERLGVEVDVPAELQRARMPSLVLQPLVENAVKHGVQQTLEHCRVEVRAVREGGRLRIVVLDDGPGFTSTDLEAVVEKGTGLANVRARLDHLFGEKSSFVVLPQGVEIAFPFQPIGDPPSEAPARRPLA